jgi:hypothetical protein
MALSIKSSGDLIAVSRLKQTDAATIGSFADVGGTGHEDGGLILFDENSGINVVDNRESDAAEKTGQVEATNVDILDQSAEGTLTAAKATPDAVAFMSAFFCHVSVEATVEAGIAITHTSRVNTYPTEPNYFTAVHRKGGSGGAPSELKAHVGCGINTFRVLAAKEEFLTVEAGVIGLGTSQDGILTETFAAHDFDAAAPADNRVTLSYDIESDDHLNATILTDSDDDGIFETRLTPSAFNATTNELDWASGHGVTGTHAVKVSYPVADDETGHYGTPSWRTDVEALQTPAEFKLKAANLQIVIGANYTSVSPPTHIGGVIQGCEVEQLEYTGDWQGNPGRCWRTGAVESNTAQSVDLNDLVQTVNIDRRAQDYLMKAAFDENLPIGLYMDAIGPEIPGTASANKFYAKWWWPKLKFLTKPMEVRDGRWVEAGSLVVLKPDSNDNVPFGPTMIVEVQNTVANYLE